ncbi:DUF6308 family protein [Arthrobacter sp. Soil763]|uniref:DUF6308 family protein n=1 Tax=Arthrobacter sp. Soil763 TaxID=1736402 RepID=UPI0006FE522B|nr:DUF6308 family protein [Arthrobacter sp. Soil763]KRE78236.1 hypothetical protein ASG71_10015 [Arthrobacter sp. Soil763]
MTARISIAGRTLSEPMATLIDYGKRYADTLKKYDFGDKGDPNILTADEIWMTRIIHSRFSRAEQTELERKSLTWSKYWAAISPSACIEDADPASDDGLYDAMQDLYSLMTDLRGVGWAKASKVLHFKRPDLYPILDSRLMDLYRVPAANAAQQYKKRGFRRMYWAAIRSDVMSNKDSLKQLREDLTMQGNEASLLSALGDLRILDILSWSR